MMKKNVLIIILTLILFLFISNNSYGMDEKSIVVILDQLSLDDVEKILPDEKYGIGFINLKTRSPYSSESLYFSMAMGKKVGVGSDHYKGLYKDMDGTINIAGFKDMLEDLSGKNHVKVDLLGSKLGDKGISYIGDSSSAILGANNDGKMKSGEIEIRYDGKWLIEKTKYHLSNSNILILSYDMEGSKERFNILEKYIKELEDANIIIVPTNVSRSMRYIINKSLVPIIYINGDSEGMVQSLSTNREGFITLEDISVELLANNGGKSPLAIGNRIEIAQRQNNLFHARSIFKKTINMMIIVYIFHGIVCLLQIYSAYYIYKNKKDKFNNIDLYNNLIIINIFISLLMGISSLHINIALYLLINLLTTYIITMFIMDRAINPIGLFSTLTYIIIIFGIFFKPEILYNSYIGFNNLFYGFRYYGLNNGIMGVLLVSSIISYFFIRELIPNRFVDKVVCFCYFMMNIVVLSANYGANTGGFLTAIVLFLIMVYLYILDKSFNISGIFTLIFIGFLIFATNMYFDYFSNEKSHAINFLIRIKTLGLSEFVNMFKIKIEELIKLTIVPPFGIAIVSQIYSLKRLSEMKNISFKMETNIILAIGIIAFILNDTGVIAFIYIIHYLISLWFQHGELHPPRS